MREAFLDATPYLLIAVLITQLIILFKKRDHLPKSFFDTLFDFSERLKTSQDQSLQNISQNIENRLDKNIQSIQRDLKEGLTNSQGALKEVVQRVSKVTEAQRHLSELSQNIMSLQDILTDKKSRGIFGEVQLKQVLVAIFGEGSGLFTLQKKLSNGKIVDAALFLPEPLGVLSIDSKFPLENFLKKIEEDSLEEKKKYKKDLKKHIDDIHERYISAQETSQYAVMFVPAEAIFSDIMANEPDVVEYGYRKNIWLCSPTTLMATLTSIQSILSTMDQYKYLNTTLEELKKLSLEFERYEERWSSLSKRLSLFSEEFHKVEVSSGKISKKFKDLQNYNK